MRLNRKFMIGVALLASIPATIRMGNAVNPQTSAVTTQVKSVADEQQMLQPRDFFSDFPAVEWEMGFREAKAAIVAAGNNPLEYKYSSNLEWVGIFNGMKGWGFVLFNSGTRVHEIAVYASAPNKQQQVFDEWRRKLINRHGPPVEIDDNSASVVNIWKLKNGYDIRLRAFKEGKPPVADIHWIRR